MEFGVGLLGQGWNVEEVITRTLASDMPANPNFYLKASNYAAKIAAETVLAEWPSEPDLSIEGIVIRCANCARPVQVSEAPMVHDAFLLEYGHLLRDAAHNE